MRIEYTEVYGWRAALRGMRNPKNSWEKSDTIFNQELANIRYSPNCIRCVENPEIGPNDMSLIKRLIKGGAEHRKFLRQIQIWSDIEVPLYVWAELDTYKICTVRNSTSTMHKLGGSDLDRSNFQDDEIEEEVLIKLNDLSKEYASSKNFELVRKMKKKLPCSYLQKATYSMNYENALSMLGQRHNHRLPEWSGLGGICEWLLCLPYMKEFYSVFEKVECQGCQNKIDRDAKFCKYCGEKL